MLDDQTKARINSARDILVGKVPDPKSQVEQITIALIYKFMDDMDRQSEELGGKASFFSDGFKKYAWHKLIDPRLSGHERLLLYAEGLEKMNENKNIPQLFRDIFKGVFLPYRDPETLNLFLKQINEFSYEHSERLGDAFEYLLSVLGSQGEAGQFRTPRHIIDFIVSIVDPKKTDTVLDPACGTAGFLISTYKHILAANSKDGSGDLLSGDERSRLMDNFCGYDISPDMVRLSRANMYLHGFPQPRIHEYDTLTSEERWDERYDVIMANPPFMTPKGGVRPHNKFSIKAKRSEVLFVDYIAEHLNVNGRAGVIVPEGIIFQSQNAYKNLRKMLVENYLWCVVSLPAGVFNPYAGVKTSILLMDKALAKHTDEILFVKIENDGFDLGAQRRPIEKNDLPEAWKGVDSWKRDQTPAAEIAHAVSRLRILESPDCSLSGDRYRPTVVRGNGKWPIAKLGDVCETTSGGTPLRGRAEYYKDGTIPWLKSGEVAQGFIFKSEEFITDAGLKNSSAKIFPKDTVLVAMYGATAGQVGLLKFESATNQAICGILPDEKFVPEFLYSVLSSLTEKLVGLSSGGAQPNVSQAIIRNLEIPVPPLADQRRLVAELEGYRKVIEACRQVLANYKPTLRLDSTWPTKKVAALCDLVRGSSPRPKADPRYYGGKVPRLMVADLTRDGMYVTPQIDFLTEEGAKFSRAMKRNEVVMAVSGNPGLPAILRVSAYIHDGFVGFRSLKDEILPEFFYYLLLHFKEHSGSQSIGAVFKNLTTDQIKDFDIPVPSLPIQRQIVAEMESERALVDANRELIARMEQKMQAKLTEVWGEETAGEESAAAVTNGE